MAASNFLNPTFFFFFFSDDARDLTPTLTSHDIPHFVGDAAEHLTMTSLLDWNRKNSGSVVTAMLTNVKCQTCLPLGPKGQINRYSKLSAGPEDSH